MVNKENDRKVAAVNLHLKGWQDGACGNRPASISAEYCLGYAEGVQLRLEKRKALAEKYDADLQRAILRSTYVDD